MGLTLASIIPAGRAPLSENLVGMYLGPGLDALLVAGAKGLWVYFRNNKE